MTARRVFLCWSGSDVRDQGVGDGVGGGGGGVTGISGTVDLAVGESVKASASDYAKYHDLRGVMTYAFFKAQIHLLRLCTFNAPSCQFVLYLISALRTSLPCSGKESTTTGIGPELSA